MNPVGNFVCIVLTHRKCLQNDKTIYRNYMIDFNSKCSSKWRNVGLFFCFRFGCKWCM